MSPRAILLASVCTLALASGCGRAAAAVDRVRELVKGDAPTGEGSDPADPEPPALADEDSGSDEPDIGALTRRQIEGRRAPARSPESGEPRETDAGDIANADDGAVVADASERDDSDEDTPQSDAACLVGTWEIADLDAFLERRLLDHTLGHPVRAKSSRGSFTLEFVAAGDGATKGVLKADAEHRLHRYDATLAGVDVRYTAHLHGRSEASWEVTEPGRLRVDDPTSGRIGGSLHVDVAGKKTDRRPLVFTEHGELDMFCAGDDLVLTTRRNGKPGTPIKWRRAGAP